MRLATVLTPITDEGLQLAAQCGVTDIVHRYPGPDRSLLQQFLYRLQPWQLRCSVIEGYLPIENLKLGQDDGREMRLMQDLIRQMGDLGVEILCYNFMAGSDWCRTQLNASERGGALVTAFDRSAAEQAVLLGYRPPDAESEAVLQGLTPEMLFENLQRLLDGLLPVAEACGVTLAMHPDDPPLPSLNGRPRIMHWVQNFQRLLQLYPSAANGICFCQGTFAAMNVDIPATIRLLGAHVPYVHFRDVRGTAERFVETFHDNGPTNMAAAMQAWKDVGFSGPMRPDHVPQLVGEEDGEPGYTLSGRLFAWGYIRGLMQAAEHAAACRDRG
jgi:mannonate dehydratase